MGEVGTSVLPTAGEKFSLLLGPPSYKYLSRINKFNYYSYTKDNYTVIIQMIKLSSSSRDKIQKQFLTKIISQCGLNITVDKQINITMYKSMHLARAS